MPSRSSCSALRVLARLHAHRLRVQHEAVHGEPDARIAERGRLAVGGRGRVHDLPVVRLEDAALLLGEAPGRVVDDEPGPEGDERGVDVDRPRVAGEVDRVHPVLGEVPPQPLHAAPVGGQPVLAEEVPSDPKHVGRVEQGLVLGGDEVEGRGPAQPLLQGDLVEVSRLVGLAGEPRARRLLPAEPRVLVEVALHERVVGQVLEVPAPERHRRAQDLAADGEEHVPGRHAAEHAARREVGGDHRPVPLDGLRTVDPDAAPFEDGGEVVELLVRAFDRLERARPPPAPHGAVLRDLRLGGGLGRGDAGVVGPPQDDVAEGVEVVPRADDGVGHGRCAFREGAGAAGGGAGREGAGRAGMRDGRETRSAPGPVSTRPVGPRARRPLPPAARPPAWRPRPPSPRPRGAGRRSRW